MKKSVLLIFLLALSTYSQAQWEEDPTINNPICVTTEDQVYPQLVSDGAGGAIITWYDRRNATDNDIYAQRIDAQGLVKWTTNGVAICTATNEQTYPVLASDGTGGAIISWIDRRNGTDDLVYAQRIDASGNVLWTSNGIAVSTEPAVHRDLNVIADGAGGAILVWADTRSSISTGYDVYSQKLNASGQLQWSSTSVPICTAIGNSQNIQIDSDGAGGAIILWEDLRVSGGMDLYAQKINATGVVQWTVNGAAICTETNSQQNPSILSDGEGGAFFSWSDKRTGELDIYAQHVNASGALLWTATGLQVCGETKTQSLSMMVSDGFGGIIMSWSDSRTDLLSYDIYAQRINSTGVFEWTSNGALVCSATSMQFYPVIASDSAGGAYIVWYDTRDVMYHIYAQHIDGDGVLGWPEEKKITDDPASPLEPFIVADHDGGVICTWADNRNSYYDIYASHILYTPTVNGIKESGSSDALTIYPNPNEGSFKIHTSLEGDFNILTQLGVVVKSFHLNPTDAEISIEELNKGVYFFTGNSDGVMVSKKIVVYK